jgi:DNA helicase-2/ATP-dependent DNA helicase PcrA
VNTPEKQSWAEGLLDEQRIAASYEGKNARLLAGPGTGKTWTLRARVEWLVIEKKVEPQAVTALTFTRAAAGELRGRVNKALEGKFSSRPHIMTLHSFALRTLLRNAKLIDALPQPLRVADDWEERYIVQEDLKTLIKSDIDTVQDRFFELSADWETLRADDDAPNELKADPKFVGAWQKHRAAYGYTLRSELVYQLKRAMEQRDDLEIHDEIQHLLVDEYQDLNACDLRVIRRLAGTDASVYAAGDDDQSIYGFRHASPEGIRAFEKDYAPSTNLPLATCIRCDRDIMDLARFVADLDPDRLDKPWQPRDKAGQGEVRLLRFDDGREEASGIASLCRYLIDEEGYQPDDILILIRSDNDRAFSRLLLEQMATAGVPFYLNVSAESPFNSDASRVFLSFIRLAVDEKDSLAWRTLLQVRKNKVGEKTIAGLTSDALDSGSTFAAVLKQAAERKEASALKNEYAALGGLLSPIKGVVGDPAAVLSPEHLRDGITRIASILTDSGVTELSDAIAHTTSLTENGEADSFKDILSALAIANAAPEQERGRGAVNMLTMHKAKGLSARAVIVMACEDQYVPGRNDSGPQEGDERRLLYVSLTRAKERLFITYAEKRLGQQRHTGRDHGKKERRLTRYLKDAPLHATPAAKFIENLAKD